jgi:Protein of unknown function (DUF1997)
VRAPLVRAFNARLQLSDFHMSNSVKRPPVIPQTRLFTSQTVEIQVPREAYPIEGYLEQPDRLVRTLAPGDRLKQLENGHYRLEILPMNILNLTISPVVDLAVWVDHDRKVQVESVGCEIRGVESLRDRFDFKLVGELYPIHTPNQILLRGSALLKIELELPLPFKVMPRSMVEGAGNAVLETTLKTVKGRMLKYVVKDYQAWVRERSGVLSSG